MDGLEKLRGEMSSLANAAACNERALSKCLQDADVEIAYLRNLVDAHQVKIASLTKEVRELRGRMEPKGFLDD